MSKKQTDNSRSAQAVRTRTHSGRTERALVRWGRKERTSTAAITEHTLHTISFKPKSGFDIYFSSFGFTEDEDYVRMFNDIWACYNVIVKTIEGRPLKMHPINDIGMSMGHAMHFLMNNIVKLLPTGASFNIGRDENKGYFLTIYKECQWSGDWMCFEVKHLLEYLQVTDKDMLIIVTKFLKLLSDCISLEFWFQGWVDSTLDYIKERLEDEEHEAEDYYARWVQAIHEYEYGAPASWKIEIQNANGKYNGTEAIRKSLNGRSGKLVQWMLSGCDLIDTGFNINRYEYNPYNNEDEFYGVRWEQQHSILWDVSDGLTIEHEQTLNDYSNEGIADPYATVVIRPEFSSANIKDIIQQEKLLIEYKKFMLMANDVLNTYNEPKNTEHS